MLVIGRQAVLEVLESPGAEVTELFVSSSTRGNAVDEIESVAASRGVAIRRTSDKRLDQLAGDDRRHQGFVAEFEPPPLLAIDAFAAGRTGRRWATQLLLLDQVHNPANVGMILRTAAAAGIDGVVLPRLGTAGIGPLTIKAGSGVVFRVPILDAASTADGLDSLVAEGFSVAVLAADGVDLFSAEIDDRVVWVLGNETVGVSNDAENRCTGRYALPLANGVESLNVAATAAVLTYDLVRRGQRTNRH